MAGEVWLSSQRTEMTFSQKFSLCRTDMQKQTLGTTCQSGSEPSFTQLSAVMALGVEAGKSGGYPGLHSELQASLGYVRLYLRKAK